MKYLISILLIFVFSEQKQEIKQIEIKPIIIVDDTPEPVIIDKSEIKTTPYKQGKASWYGPGFHGNQTANGEIYNQEELTCASPNLRFGTQLKVTNLDNNKSIIVRVNDRGPYGVDSVGKLAYPIKPHPTRLIDLSKAAFDSLAHLDKGVIKIKIEKINHN